MNIVQKMRVQIVPKKSKKHLQVQKTGVQKLKKHPMRVYKSGVQK